MGAGVACLPLLPLAVVLDGCSSCAAVMHVIAAVWPRSCDCRMVFGGSTGRDAPVPAQLTPLLALDVALAFACVRAMTLHFPLSLPFALAFLLPLPCKTDGVCVDSAATSVVRVFIACDADSDAGNGACGSRL